MELNTESLTGIAALVAATTSIIALWKSCRDKRFDEIKADMRVGFDKIDKKFEKIDEKIDTIQYEIGDIRERMVGLEMSVILVQVNSTPASREEAIRKIVGRRPRHVTKAE